MKKITILMIMMGLVGISACASNEANMESTENDVQMAKDKAEAEEARAKADLEEAKAKAEAEEARAKADAEEAKAKAETEEARAKADAEQAMADAESAKASAMAAGDSDSKVSVCEHGNQTRTITVIFDDETTGKACRVDYEKSTGVQTLWTANTDKDYCLDQAEAFVQKQEGWGWTCSPLQ